MATKKQGGNGTNGNGSNAGKIGLGVAAIAAAAAGAYFFYGSKNAVKNRRNLKSWAVKARGEVMENLEKLSDVTEQSYNKVVKDVLAKYKKLKNVAPGELAEMQKELTSSWRSIKTEVQKAAKKVTKK